MRKLVASCSAVLIAITVLAACGGSSKPKVSSLAPGKNGNPLTGTGSDTFSKLVAAGKKEKFKVTYKQDSGGSLTLAQDGKGDSAYITADGTFITNKDGTTVSCTTDSSSGTTQCQQLPSTGLGGFGAVFASAQAYIGLANLGHSSTETIAGRQAQCVTISAKDYAGKLSAAALGAAGKSLKASETVCVDKKTGALLKFGGTNEAGKQVITLEATDVGTPSADDFTPPVTPVTGITAPSISLPPGVTLPPGITIPGQ